MHIAIISSNEDPASVNIRGHLLQHLDWNPLQDAAFDGNPVFVSQTKEHKLLLVAINDIHIRRENVDAEIRGQHGFDPEAVIVVSRHRAESGKRSLTVHPVGNYGAAEFGGKDKTLAPSAPSLMAAALRILKRKSDEKDISYDVCYEVTHHGPYVETPLMFIEIGSSGQEWGDDAAGSAIAETLAELFLNPVAEPEHVLVGIGGGHYAPRFTDLVLEYKNVAIGHMIPNYRLESPDFEMAALAEAFKKTPGATAFYLSRKALGKEMLQRINEWIDENGFERFSGRQVA
ncbi:MAG: transposase [Thermoplasmata archaeon HGW-Thermoplasmata-1]|nr:MAG: transposase [Thermoplasmata archaeon HGW-Thermoplasmata-1]